MVVVLKAQDCRDYGLWPRNVRVRNEVVSVQ